MDADATGKVKSIVLEAVVVRDDGSREELGEIDRWEEEGGELVQQLKEPN